MTNEKTYFAKSWDLLGCGTGSTEEEAIFSHLDCSLGANHLDQPVEVGIYDITPHRGAVVHKGANFALVPTGWTRDKDPEGNEIFDCLHVVKVEMPKKRKNAPGSGITTDDFRRRLKKAISLREVVLTNED